MEKNNETDLLHLCPIAKVLADRGIVLTGEPTTCTAPRIEDWIDNQDAAMLLHLSKRKLQYLRTEGKLPYTTLDGKVYYLRSDIEKLLLAHYPTHLKEEEGGCDDEWL